MSAPRPRTMREVMARSPGERAFDWCLWPLGLQLVLVALETLLGFDKDYSLAEAVPAVGWVYLALGGLMAVNWAYALYLVWRAWKDPMARVLRFASVHLLAAQAAGVLALSGLW